MTILGKSFTESVVLAKVSQLGWLTTPTTSSPSQLTKPEMD